MTIFQSHAKWILSGEHSVVRGGKAIAFPLRRYTCTLDYREGTDELNVSVDHFCRHADVSDGEDIVLELITKAANFLDISPKQVSGNITVKSDIPLRAGLGSSAAICANITKLFNHWGFCDKSDLMALARYLEDTFHYKSSGLDIAVTLLDRPIIFRHNKVMEILEDRKFHPTLILSYSGEPSSTSACAATVKEMFLKNERLALQLDEQMNQASDLCEYAVKNSDFNKLKEGITLGNNVFQEWGLYNNAMSFHAKKLAELGAVAVKPVGSGLGGYILSLWTNLDSSIISHRNVDFDFMLAQN